MRNEEKVVDETLDRALRQLLDKIPGLVGLVLTDANGISVSSSFMEDSRVKESSAISVVAVDVAVRISKHLALGVFESITFSFSHRYLHVSGLADRKVYLLVVADKDVNRGLLDITLEEVKGAIEKLMGDLVYV